ncbi:DUF202 domain-containing protein [Streptomyces sp. Z26]|uniref:DUF202 domain-containing protein n=1 Tax=Streptomyces TaxID=1883 RepID=UPI000EF14F90|nr:DUF202 domain-containing protein [Streptomyces sp. Z26]RLL66078.1 DUF202 domain-containing protein [Streptomyces sp. Z26]
MSTPYGAEAADERDRGAQPERTRLAWRRTTLAFAVAGALGVRSVLDGARGPSAYAVAATSALVWLCFLAVAHRRIHTLSADPAGPGAGRAVRWATGCTLALALLGMLLLA